VSQKKSKQTPEAVERRALKKRKIVFRRPYLYPEQEEFLYNPARYSIVEAATKVGKTYGCIVWILEQACITGGPGKHFWWVAPNYSQAAIAFERACLYAPKWAIKPNKTAMSIRIINGAVINFKSGEKPDNLYGEDVWACVIDEATRMREAAWIAIRTTLTATKGPVRIIGNVKGKRNWAYRLARKAEDGADNTYHARLDALTAAKYGIYNVQEMEEARNHMPEDAWKELYMAIPTADGANPFGHDNIAACGLPGLAPGPAVAFGVDVARKADWTVVVGLNRNLQVCYFDRLQRTTWPEIEKRVMVAIKNKPTLVDSTGVGDNFLGHIQVKCASAEGYVFTNRSKQDLMEHLSFGIQQHKLGIPILNPGDDINKYDDTNPKILTRELMDFEYGYTDSKVVFSAPEGDHDDCVCALALAYMAATRFSYVTVKPHTEKVYAPYAV